MNWLDYFISWSDYFARCEADQLRRLPLQSPRTPLEAAQHKIALEFCRTTFPVDEWPEKKSNEPTVFWADLMTRQAFFDHFGGSGGINIFCLLDQERDAIIKRRRKPSDILPYISRDHTITRCLEMRSEFFDNRYKRLLSSGLHIEDLFLQESGLYIGPLAADGNNSAWHWNGESLVHLPEYDEFWVA